MSESYGVVRSGESTVIGVVKSYNGTGSIMLAVPDVGDIVVPYNSVKVYPIPKVGQRYKAASGAEVVVTKTGDKYITVKNGSSWIIYDVRLADFLTGYELVPEPLPKVGDRYKRPDSPIATVISATELMVTVNYLGWGTVIYPTDEFMRCWTLYTPPADKSVWLVHRGGVEKALQTPSGKIKRKNKVEAWENSNVFSTEALAYGSLLNRLAKQRSDIADQVMRIHGRDM